MVNEDLIKDGKEPIVFDHDCREGICGMCSAVVNGVPHGGQKRTTLCQLHMRKFKDGDAIYLEPWRARAFPILKDLMVDRGALTGSSRRPAGPRPTPAASPTATPSPSQARRRLRHGRGRVHRLRRLRGGLPERRGDALRRRQGLPARGAPARPGGGAASASPDDRGDAENGFGNCSNHYECQAACPKGINVKFIARLNREFHKAIVQEKVGALAALEGGRGEGSDTAG